MTDFDTTASSTLDPNLTEDDLLFEQPNMSVDPSLVSDSDAPYPLSELDGGTCEGEPALPAYVPVDLTAQKKVTPQPKGVPTLWSYEFADGVSAEGIAKQCGDFKEAFLGEGSELVAGAKALISNTIQDTKEVAAEASRIAGEYVDTAVDAVVETCDAGVDLVVDSKVILLTGAAEFLSGESEQTFAEAYEETKTELRNRALEGAVDVAITVAETQMKLEELEEERDALVEDASGRISDRLEDAQELLDETEEFASNRLEDAKNIAYDSGVLIASAAETLVDDDARESVFGSLLDDRQELTQTERVAIAVFNEEVPITASPEGPATSAALPLILGPQEEPGGNTDIESIEEPIDDDAIEEEMLLEDPLGEDDGPSMMYYFNSGSEFAEVPEESDISDVYTDPDGVSSAEDFEEPSTEMFAMMVEDQPEEAVEEDAVVAEMTEPDVQAEETEEAVTGNFQQSAELRDAPEGVEEGLSDSQTVVLQTSQEGDGVSAQTVTFEDLTLDADSQASTLSQASGLEVESTLTLEGDAVASAAAQPGLRFETQSGDVELVYDADGGELNLFTSTRYSVNPRSALTMGADQLYPTATTPVPTGLQQAIAEASSQGFSRHAAAAAIYSGTLSSGIQQKNYHDSIAQFGAEASHELSQTVANLGGSASDQNQHHQQPDWSIAQA